MNLPSPVIAAHPPSRPRARWPGVLALCFGAVAAGVFY